MSYLLRVVLPDRPGALGAVATALGTVEADIVSVDVIERGAGFAIDDLVVELPTSRLADSLVTAASSVDGVHVESIRPYAAVLDPNRELELIDALVDQPSEALTILSDGVAKIFRAGWALVLGEDTAGWTDGEAGAGAHRDPGSGTEGGADTSRFVVRAGSAAAPELTTLAAPWWPVARAKTLDVGEDWVPDGWAAVGTELAVAPLGRDAVLVGRPALRWLPAELIRLNHLAGILTTVL